LKEVAMELTSNRLRIIVILVLIFIAGGAIILLSQDGNRGNSVTISAGDRSGELRGFTSIGASGSTASTDPCNVVGQSEVESELGMEVGDPQGGYAENPLGERFCRFPDPDRTSKDLVNISITFNDSIDPALLNDGYTVDRMYEGRKVSPDLIQIVDGVGDDAFWGGAGDDFWNGLHILVHDIYVQVDVSSGDEEIDYQAARNIAVIALERIFGP
jgi:hypothetical protein